MMIRALCVVVMTGLIAGCSSAPATRSVVVPADALVAVAGAPLVFAVPGSAQAEGTVVATLDGRLVPAWVRRVVVRRDDAGEQQWLRGSAAWHDVDDVVDGALTFVHVEIPGDATSGVLEVAGSRRPVRVWPAGEPVAAPALRGDGSLYADEGASATDFWRHALAGFTPEGLVDRHPAERAAALSLAAQWRTALARLEIADRWLAGRVMVALTRTAEVSGKRAPAWTADSDADDRLRRQLLDETLSHAAVAERARAWLGLQPELVARVRDPASAGVVAAQVTDLSGRGGAASLSDGRRDGSSVFLRGGRSVLLPAPVSDQERNGAVLIASAGARSVALHRPEETIAASPPGARLGPLMQDLTMQRWLTGDPAVPGAEHATAALVYRRAHANVWELYIECKSSVVHERDRVNVWFGPRDESVVVVTVDRSGVLLSDREMPAVDLAARSSGDDRWSATITVPAEAVGPDGSVLIGLTREFGDGGESRRMAHPVALLPWEEEPGRVSISLTGWFRLSTSPPG